MASTVNLYQMDVVIPNVGDTVVDRETGEKWKVTKDDWTYEMGGSWIYTLVSKTDPAKTCERMDEAFITHDDEPADWYVEDEHGNEMKPEVMP